VSDAPPLTAATHHSMDRTLRCCCALQPWAASCHCCGAPRQEGGGPVAAAGGAGAGLLRLLHGAVRVVAAAGPG
jgi:hypothetical protein